MKKYRRSSQPVESEHRLPRNPIPWTTKLLIGLLIGLAGLFAVLVISRKDRLPVFDLLVEKISSREGQGTDQPQESIETPAPTPTFPPGSAWLAAIKVTTIYSDPGEDQARLGILEGGEQARIIGKEASGEWWAIRVPYVEGEIGWVNDAEVLTYDTAGVSELSALEAGDTEETPTIPADQLPMLSAIANTNVRSGPGLEFERIGLLSEGQQAEILGKDPDAFWWMIKIASVEGERGWVARDYVVAQNAEEVPVIGTSSIQFGAIPTPAAGEPALTSSLVVNIRAGPGTNFAIIGKLAPDQPARVVGVSADGAWWAILIPSAQNERGWISSQYATVENSADVPVIR